MENILMKIAKGFDKHALSVEFLTQYRNTIYKVYCLDYIFILRLTNENYRSIEQIESELDFQRYLFRNGANVSQPLKTESGESCVIVEMNNQKYLVSAFEYSHGKNWYERDDNSEETYIHIGKALGKIHKLSKEYIPVNVVKRRLWSEQQELIKADVLFRNYSSELHNIFTEYMRQMDKEIRNENNFGLTHGDYLCSNYLIDGNNHFTVIDFDECEYSWFAADLAICMRCYLFNTEKPFELPEKAKEAERMHYNLLLGYKSENNISKEMVFELDKYFKIRDFIELSQLLGHQESFNDIEKVLFDMNLDRILNNKPFLQFNTEKAEKLLM